MYDTDLYSDAETFVVVVLFCFFKNLASQCIMVTFMILYT